MRPEVCLPRVWRKSKPRQLIPVMTAATNLLTYTFAMFPNIPTVPPTINDIWRMLTATVTDVCVLSYFVINWHRLCKAEGQQCLLVRQPKWLCGGLSCLATWRKNRVLETDDDSCLQYSYLWYRVDSCYHMNAFQYINRNIIFVLFLTTLSV